MSGVRILGATSGCPWLAGLLRMIGGRCAAEANDTPPDGVLVVDDGSVAAARALREALAWREDRPGLPIAVIRTVGDGAASEAGVRALLPAGHTMDGHLPAEQLRALCEPSRLELGVRISDRAITFEYP